MAVEVYLTDIFIVKMAMIKLAIRNLFLFFLLVGCNKIDSNTTTINTPSVKIIPPTMEDWNKALFASYKESLNKKNHDDESITESLGAFYNNEGYVVTAWEDRDAFRKIRFFKPNATLSLENSTSFSGYIALPDGGTPIFFLTSYYFSKNGWMFMRGISVMVDGEVIFEKNFSEMKVKRNSEVYGVEESIDFVVDNLDLIALRKINQKSKIKIRISGDKGYIMVKNDGVKYLDLSQNSIIDAIKIYDEINHAVDGHSLKNK